MTVRIDEIEAYPIYELRDEKISAPEFEVDEKIIERWRSIIEQYDTVQEEMRAVYEARIAPTCS